jgi:hypothetical protein
MDAKPYIKAMLPREFQQIDTARSPLFHLLPVVLLITLVCAPVLAKDKEKGNPQGPYATAENETAPAVNAADLAYRSILFEEFSVPAEYEKAARGLVTATEDRAISRLDGTRAFTKIARKDATLPQDPYLLVKCTLLNYRLVSKKARFFGGAFAGTSYLTYRVQVSDQNGTQLFQREISTENNPIAAAWSFNDKNLPNFLGNVLGDYLSLRARKDMGASAFPLESAEHVESPASTQKQATAAAPPN